MSNTQSYKKYATVSEQLSRDVADEVDLNGYAHALRDNDIRHIRNSHGERTAEKYPVTKEDIKNIPWLVQNYDKVLAVKRTDGKTGIVYVKAMPNGLVYYLEQVTSVYGNEPLLINKQMIKTGMEDIPDLKGLREAITKKQSETEFLDDLKQAPQVYAQSVRQFHSSNSIADGNQDVKQGTEQSTTSMTNREALAWVLENKELQRIDPRTRTVLQEYGRHLQQLQQIRQMQSQLQPTGTDASTSQLAQRNFTKLEGLYDRHERRLTDLEKNPRLQRLAQQTLTDLAPSESETVEPGQNIDVDNAQTHDKIKADENSADAEAESVVEVILSRKQYPQTSQHVLDAVAAGMPEILTIDREHAKENRRRALAGMKKSSEYDLDEYPPAMFKEGGEGASVRPIQPSDNRGAGSVIGHQLRSYPDGTKIRIKIVD